VWVDACGGLEEDAEDPTEPDPKKELLWAASWLIRDETPRLPPVVAAALPPPEPAWAPRTATERMPKPTAAAPADATYTKRARRRAAVRREGEGVELTSPSKRPLLRAACDPGCARVKEG
jgi:hypothetical protein